MNYIITMRNNSAKVKKESAYAEEKTGLRKSSNYVYFLKLQNQDVANAF